MFKKMEKIMSIFRTYIENIKKTQAELPEMKNIIFDMKKTHWQELHWHEEGEEHPGLGTLQRRNESELFGPERWNCKFRATVRTYWVFVKIIQRPLSLEDYYKKNYFKRHSFVRTDAALS